MARLTSTAPLTKDVVGLADLFLTSGTAHLVKPELVCAAGLLHPRTRRVAGWASAVLLVGILPGNLQMAADHGRRAQRKGTTSARAAFVGSLARLPLQWPMIRTALRAAGRS